MDEQMKAAKQVKSRATLRAALGGWAKTKRGQAGAHAAAPARQSPAPAGRETGSAAAGRAAAPSGAAPELGSAAHGAADPETDGRGTPSGQRAEAGQ